MRFFHLSDLHIGLKLINRDLGEDQRFILRQIVEKAEAARPDAVVIAGDIYDKSVPSADAVEIFDDFIFGLRKAVPEAEIMMISGNHDSAPRVNLFRRILGREKIHMIGIPPQSVEDHMERVTLQDEYGPVHFYLLPFVRPSMVRNVIGTREDGSGFSYDETIHRLMDREEIDTRERNVLVSHQFYLPKGTEADTVERMDSEILTIGNIDRVTADVLQQFDYAALGHIHKPMRVGSEYARYCGTPMACSVSEAGQKKGILQVDLGKKGEVSVSVLPLTPLREIRTFRGDLDEVLRQGCEDYAVVTLTDVREADALDMQDRVRNAFPNLLEIRREGLPGVDYRADYAEEAVMNSYDLCCSFLGEPDEGERSLLKDVINTVGDGEP
ncbi:MAG: exonuclease SbcCD subunit D [Bilifractor sp.]|nr:exonuclease SbcCD subunit D [Lachnospiraceae bacterium]MDY2837284.1 exonuclease SbcCD subunit D [Bilifractor sp.]